MQIKIILFLALFGSITNMFAFKRDYIGSWDDCNKFEQDLQQCETKRRFNRLLKRSQHLRRDCEKFQKDFEDDELARHYNMCIVEALYIYLKAHCWQSSKVPQKLDLLYFASNDSFQRVRSTNSIGSSSYSEVWPYEPPAKSQSSE